jgi:hypothetical protein
MSNESPRVQLPVAIRNGRSRVSVVGLILLTAALSFAFAGIPLFGTVVLKPVAGLVLPSSLVLGISGVLGVGAGILVGKLLAGTFVLNDALLIVTYCVVGLVARALWRTPVGTGRVGVASSTRTAAGVGGAATAAPRRLLRRSVRYAVVSTPAAIAGATTLSWLYQAFSVAPFFIAPIHAVGFLLSAFLIGLPLFLFGEFLFRRRDDGSESDRWRPMGARTWLVVAIGPVVWLLAGTLTSTAYGAFDPILTAYPYWFTDRGLGFVRILYNDGLFGAGGDRVQLVLGGAILGVVLYPVIRAIPREREEGDNG